MKHNTLILCICSVVLVTALLAAGCTSAPKTGTTPATQVPTPVAPVTTIVTPGNPASATCGFTTCHGFDLACGTNGPQICTTDYQPGDKCRQYAQCSSGSDGSCSLVTSPQYDSCKTCAQNCELRAGADNLAAASCEEQC
ncbi:hypothetical protein [Methanoregula sp.]|jgi:hypothetical protein|uniref:hypothetical protein n=1 Tax=Methanoregula sp. TaxID=2052170 RepID=UPI003C25DBBC